MPDIGVFHPQVVHFVVALLVVGVPLRVVGILSKRSWMDAAAVTLLILGTLASVAAVRSGDDAHGPVERLPGARPMVEDHEHWGERTRNIFLAVTGIELLALVTSDPRRRMIRAASAAIGLGGLFAVYQTGELGGKIVYSHAGGVGIRSGDPADVNRLLLAGLYNQALQDRQQGRGEDAARLFQELKTRFPEDISVQILAAESLLRDKHDAAAARAAIDSIAPAESDVRNSRNLTLLKVDVLAAAGHRDSARVFMQQLVDAVPTNARYKAKLDSLQ